MKKVVLTLIGVSMLAASAPAFARHDGYYGPSANDAYAWQETSRDYQMAQYGRTYSTYYDRGPAAAVQAPAQNDISCTEVLIFFSHCSSHPRVTCYDANGQPFTVDKDSNGHAVPNTAPMRRAPDQVTTTCGGNTFSASGGESASAGTSSYGGATQTSFIQGRSLVTVTTDANGNTTTKVTPIQ